MRLPVLERPILFVNEALLRNSTPRGVQPEQMTYWGEGEILQLDAIVKPLRKLMTEFAHDSSKSDGSVAVELHRLLPLTRREAAEMPFWHFLSIIEFPEYVAWRYFDPAKERTNKERFIGLLADNAFSRLWWWARLTYDHDAPDPYHRTKTGAQNLELVKSVVENLFGGNRLLVASLIDFVCASPDRMSDQKVKQLTMRINALLVTIAVDLMPEKAVRQIPRDIAAATQ